MIVSAAENVLSVCIAVTLWVVLASTVIFINAIPMRHETKSAKIGSPIDCHVTLRSDTLPPMKNSAEAIMVIGMTKGKIESQIGGEVRWR